MKINKVKEISTIARDKKFANKYRIDSSRPGETYDSWKDTLDTVLEAKIVTMDIFYLQLLVNAPMYVNDMDKYNLETFPYDYFHDFNVKRIQEEINFKV